METCLNWMLIKYMYQRQEMWYCVFHDYTSCTIFNGTLTQWNFDYMCDWIVWKRNSQYDKYRTGHIAHLNTSTMAKHYMLNTKCTTRIFRPVNCYSDKWMRFNHITLITSFDCILYIPYIAASTAKHILFQGKLEATVHMDIGQGISGAEQTKT